MKAERIQFDVEVLRTIFSKELEPHGLGATTNRFDGLHWIKECIDFAEGLNNWHDDDQELFDAETSLHNQRYKDFLELLDQPRFRSLTSIDKGTLFVISASMIDDLINVGPADDYGKVAFNSWINMLNQNQSEVNKRERSILRRKKVGLIPLSRGPKGSPYFTLYATWLQRLLPWLERIVSSRVKKDALMLLGIVLHSGGFGELRGQYDQQGNTTKVLMKDGSVQYNELSFQEYLYSRMKAVYSRTIPILPNPF